MKNALISSLQTNNSSRHTLRNSKIYAINFSQLMLFVRNRLPTFTRICFRQKRNIKSSMFITSDTKNNSNY